MSAATKRQVAFDMLLNVVATALPLVVLQVIVLPLMAYNMEGEEYGLVVTILSAFSVIPGVLGNTLNNIRLIYDKKYKDCSLSGDFNPMVLAASAVSFLAKSQLRVSWELSISSRSLCLGSLQPYGLSANTTLLRSE